MYEEQISIFGDDLSRDPTYQELQDMKYTEIFIKESQRLVPAVPFVGRHAIENITLRMLCITIRIMLNIINCFFL